VARDETAERETTQSQVAISRPPESQRENRASSARTSDPTPSTEGQTSQPGVFLLNLVMIVLLGVAVSGWFLHFTDWFPELGGLLALGGVASWLAFVLKVLSEERIKSFQMWADRVVLGHKRTTVIVILIAGGLVLLSTVRGTIAVSSLYDSGDRAVWIFPMGTEKGEPIQLPPGGSIKRSLFTGFHLQSSYVVKVSGYPDRVVQMASWRTSPVYVPSSLLRPTVVLLPAPELIQSARNPDAHMKVSVSIESKALHTKRELNGDFDGHALWVSCDEDLQVPAAVQSVWRAKLAASPYEPLLAYWTTPQKLNCDQRLELNPSDTITVQLTFNGRPYGDPQTFKVLPLRTSGSYPQEEVLHEPSDSSTKP